jgi:DNA polymerase-3 subunit chi
MTRIDFYLDAPDKIAVASRLAAKAYAASHRVTVYAPDEATARALDRLLWTTPAIAFVPHVMAHDLLAAETPVVIARDDTNLAHDDVLINLDAELPTFFSRFKRVLEVVATDEEDKARARARFKFYRDRGYPLHTHPLGNDG